MNPPRVGPAPLIPGFTYVKDLGAGGYSSVYLFERHLPRRHVAVKVMNGDIGPDGTAAFESEANKMALLSSHPAILSIYEAGITEDGRPFLVMEYCPPPHLGGLIAGGQMSVSDMLSTTIQIAGAAETAHRMGIVHRDIKPSNILITPYHRPVLCDFGISALTGRTAEQDLRGMSVPWAPPEQLAGTAGADPRVDVYSLGATAYAMLAGHSPYEAPGGANGVYEVSRRIVSQPLPQIEREDVPSGLFQILSIAMSKNPENRYASPLAFARALQKIEIDLGLNVTPVDLMRGPDDLAVALSDGMEDEGATRVGVFRRVDIDAPATAREEGAPPSEPSDAGDAPRAADGARRRARTWTWVGAIAVVLTAAGLIVASGLLRTDDSAPTGDLVPSGSQPHDSFGDEVPGPRAVQGRAVDDEVEFTWLAPEDGWSGSYLYREDLPGGQSDAHPLFEPKVRLRRQPGRTCVRIIAVREDGRSSDPVSSCVDTP
ncbi:serine/threonine protein kinase [Actinomyces sp. B33]|uniref:serine/threonine-protein kinase n=1 Tax=Actinomyces sp. B33 TaxID=2942131 RepID=UPI0023407814|nr:serine/threonine-protein kinase [Actinomyces sp. B33]MDC4233622.1 serine/threonine protein kinase [Actinomyces sp. B33]